MNNEFKQYAVKHLGMSRSRLESYMNITSQRGGGYISPTIIEERQLNVAQMDVFSRLMMDRIIFLGTAIDDYTANVIQAQLLYLDSSDPGKDISIYINSPVAPCTPAWVSTTPCSSSRATSPPSVPASPSMAAVLLVAGTPEAVCPHPLPRDDPSADGRRAGTSIQTSRSPPRDCQDQAGALHHYLNHSGKPIEDVERDSTEISG